MHRDLALEQRRQAEFDAAKTAGAVTYLQQKWQREDAERGAAAPAGPPQGASSMGDADVLVRGMAGPIRTYVHREINDVISATGIALGNLRREIDHRILSATNAVRADLGAPVLKALPPEERPRYRVPHGLGARR
jgi:hypothetical protein